VLQQKRERGRGIHQREASASESASGGISSVGSARRKRKSIWAKMATEMDEMVMAMVMVMVMAMVSDHDKRSLIAFFPSTHHSTRSHFRSRQAIIDPHERSLIPTSDR